MAQVTTKKVSESAATLVLRVYLESDGTGELEDSVLLSPSDLAPAGTAKPTFKIMEIWYQMVWFDITMKFGGIEPRPAWTLARDTGNHVDFRSIGGLMDNATVPPSDQNGKLLISTNGFELGSQGSLVLALRKH